MMVSNFKCIYLKINTQRKDDTVKIIKQKFNLLKSMILEIYTVKPL